MISVDQVRDALGLDPADAADDAWLASCVDAVNDWVSTLPVVVDSPTPAVWSPSVVLGATLLAVHEYQSRGAPYGRAVLDAAGMYQSVYSDPEIARLLRLRRWAKPGVAGAPETTPTSLRRAL